MPVPPEVRLARHEIDVDDDGHHAAADDEGVGPLLISDTPSNPLVFADILQNEAQDDLIYADP
jgi:hypothetical protein